MVDDRLETREVAAAEVGLAGQGQGAREGKATGVSSASDGEEQAGGGLGRWLVDWHFSPPEMKHMFYPIIPQNLATRAILWSSWWKLVEF